MKNTAVKINFTSDSLMLNGVLHLPETDSPPVVFGSHGLEGSKESAKQMVLARRLVKQGIAFFRFDHRGCGRSQGDFLTETSLEKRTRDLVRAVEHVLSLKKTSRRIALFGSSMGGATCINAWQTIKQMDLSLQGAVLCSAPVQSLTIENLPVEANGDRPALPLSFFADNLVFDLSEKAARLSHLLIFHGDADEVVPVSNGKKLYRAAMDPKELVLHEGGDHQMTSKTDQADFDTRAIQWFSRLFHS